tara:strand:+ start:1776 stop:2051 length:276 start_codon:yes stop_codon:yes gene_type:complete
MKATKQFKIGESAIGGIIQVTLDGNILHVKALDYYTKKELGGQYTGSFQVDHRGSKGWIDTYLNELTSSYYAEKVMEWIATKVEFKSEFNW